VIPKIIKETLSTEGIRSKPIDLLLLNVKKTNYITKLMYTLRIEVNCKNKRSSESKLENYVIVFSNFIHIIVTLTSQSEQYKYI